MSGCRRSLVAVAEMTVFDASADLGYLYRYEDQLVGNYSFDINGEAIRTGPPSNHVVLRKYRIVKKTPQGHWIESYDGRKYVRETARKRYACTTPELAIESFIARKKRQLSIYQSRVRSIEEAIYRAKTGKLTGYVCPLNM